MAAQPTEPVPETPPLGLQEVCPNHGPLSGGERILLVGRGFGVDQRLLVRFGHGTGLVETKWMNPYTLSCRLPPSDSARCVVVTLHWQDKTEPIPSLGDVLFTYKGAKEDLSVSVVHRCHVGR